MGLDCYLYAVHSPHSEKAKVEEIADWRSDHKLLNTVCVVLGIRDTNNEQLVLTLAQVQEIGRFMGNDMPWRRAETLLTQPDVTPLVIFYVSY